MVLSCFVMFGCVFWLQKNDLHFWEAFRLMPLVWEIQSRQSCGTAVQTCSNPGPVCVSTPYWCQKMITSHILCNIIIMPHIYTWKIDQESVVQRIFPSAHSQPSGRVSETSCCRCIPQAALGWMFWPQWYDNHWLTIGRSGKCDQPFIMEFGVWASACHFAKMFQHMSHLSKLQPAKQ